MNRKKRVFFEISEMNGELFSFSFFRAFFVKKRAFLKKTLFFNISGKHVFQAVSQKSF